jgi:3-phenylpropionate/trans-cinnamate dioxygenase ferredoxin subunit
MGWIRIASSDDIDERPRVYEVTESGRRIALVRAEGELCAFEDRCSHDGGTLAEGTLAGCVIECPRHGARFDVATGRVLRMPAAAPIETFPTREEEGSVYILVEEGPVQ